VVFLGPPGIGKFRSRIRGSGIAQGIDAHALGSINGPPFRSRHRFGRWSLWSHRSALNAA